MGKSSAWFSPDIRAGDEYEFDAEKSGREPAAESLVNLTRAADERASVIFRC